MAKRKTPKVKDLRPSSITTSQLEELQSIINLLNRSQMELGQLETRKHELLHNTAGIKDNLKVLQTTFEKDYGSIDINIQDGSIKYPEDEQTNKED
tara:strand:+ start:899 stop:1186 length:288 start_codon:yes stop_codon:yes gene_type:complete